jgi:hypothetical protein
MTAGKEYAEAHPARTRFEQGRTASKGYLGSENSGPERRRGPARLTRQAS